MRPILLSFGPIEIIAAPVFAGLSSLLAFLYVRRYRKHADISLEELWSLMLFLLLGTMVGGVLLYVFLYGGGIGDNIEYVLKWRRVPGGSFFGNLWGAALAVMLFVLWRGKPFAPLADLIGAAAPLGLALQRFGCLQHGCCYGRPADLPWAIIFTPARSGIRASLRGIPLHPTQLYESLGCVLIFLFVHFVVFRRIRDGRAPAGLAFTASLALYAILRFIFDPFRGGDFGVLRPLGLTTAQLLSMLTFAGAAAYTLVLARDED